MIVSCIPFNSFANEISTYDTYVSKELGVTFEKIIEKDKITVIARTLDGAIAQTAINYNGKIYIDGKLVTDINDSYSNIRELNVTSLDNPLLSLLSTITWGPWQNNTIATFYTVINICILCYVSLEF